jgi:tetratricopeptide (TPR) repeat protein
VYPPGLVKTYTGQGQLMKIVKGFIAFFLVATVVILVAKYFNVGLVREYTGVNSDKTINDLKEKIADLEKEKIKDTRTMISLADNYSRLGTIYIGKRLWDPAIESYLKSMKYGKDTPGLYYSAGLAYGNRGAERDSREDIDKAEHYYNKAIAMQENYSDAQNALAILLFYHKDEKNKALSLIQEVVGHNKKNYMARFTQARFYYEMDKIPQALSVYEDLNADLEKLPPSGVKDEYMKNCRDNIQRIMIEVKKKKTN